jgi:hypothetical protein
VSLPSGVSAAGVSQNTQTSGWGNGTRYLLLTPKLDSDTQVTPQGATIPVPKRGEFDANLDKLLKGPPAAHEGCGASNVSFQVASDLGFSL